MQRLEVVNQMLATMGERPLNTLQDPHAYRGSALSTLDNSNRNIQGRGWWFNKENLTVSPGLDGKIILPGDTINVRCPTKFVVQRGRYLYDSENGTDVFTDPIDVRLVRLIAFEDLPETAAQYIAARAVLRFQSSFDGDELKMRNLGQEVKDTFTAIMADDTRNARANLLQSNVRLQQIKNVTRGARRTIRGY